MLQGGDASHSRAPADNTVQQTIELFKQQLESVTRARDRLAQELAMTKDELETERALR